MSVAKVVPGRGVVGSSVKDKDKDGVERLDREPREE